MPIALVAGAFGQGNPGDEALLDVFSVHLEGWDLIATSSDPGTTEAEHGCGAVHSRDPAAVLKATRAADAVVFAGGTVFKSLHRATGRPALDLLRKALALAAGARALGKRVALLGVGAGRLEGPTVSLFVRALARRCDLLVLRDEESADALTAAGVAPPLRIGTDPVWALFGGVSRRAGRDGTIGVVLSHLAGGDELPDLIAASLSPLVERGLPVVLQPWQSAPRGFGDVGLARAVATRIDPSPPILPAPRDLLEARGTLSRFRLAVSLRFHGAMVAAVAGTPFVSVVHEAKLAAIARRLGQPSVPIGMAPASIERTIVDALDSHPAPRVAVEQELRTAAEGFRLLRLVLADGRVDDAHGIEGLRLGPTPWLG